MTSTLNGTVAPKREGLGTGRVAAAVDQRVAARLEDAVEQQIHPGRAEQEALNRHDALSSQYRPQVLLTIITVER